MRIRITALGLFIVMTTVVSLPAEEPIKIGIIFARTGPAAPDSAVGFDAARFAAGEINRRGGVLKRPVELLEFDNKSTPLESRRAARAAVEHGAVCVIGAVWSSHSLAMARELQKQKIPMISPSSTLPELTLTGDHIFRICHTDTFQGEVLANFALEDLAARTAVVLTNTNSRYSMGLSGYFTRHFQKKGQLLWEGDYSRNATDFSTMLTRVQALKPDLVFVPDHFRESAYIIRQARTMGIGSVFLGGDGWEESMYKYGGNAINGSYRSASWHPGATTEKARRFVKRYTEKNSGPVQSDEARTYDALLLLADAMERAGSAAPASIRKALAETRNFQGVTGSITFDSNGDPIDRPLFILKFDNSGSVLHRRKIP
ncbi:MAG: ABC transporter substrate-binding protein [Desulfobacteraceae bacterium]|nr:ABC transporter substrate-binding protein [Desulfobacteraceae bacterium]